MKNYFIQNPDSINKMIKATSSRILGLLLIFILNLNISFGQSVTTEKAFASGCYFYGGNSKTTISVQVGWTVAVNGDLIKVVLDGSTTRTIKPESLYDPGTGSAIAGPMVTPQVVAFEINTDGISHKIEVDLFSSTNVLKASAADVFVTAPTPCAPIACSGTSLGGMVYFDNNADGIHDAGETQGIDNVTITAFDKNGNVYNATSDGYGKYAFSAALGNNIAAANFPVRLEFTNWPTNVMSNSGPSLTGNKSGVRFVAAAACNVDCGGVYPLNYSQSNPKIFNNICTNGDPLAGGTAGTEPGLIAHDYTNNTDYNFQTIVQQKLIGSVWAKAWNKFEKKLIVSAFLKRHCGFGPLGSGGLYILNYTNPGSPVFTQLIDVTSIGIDVGQALIPTNAARGLLANKDTPNKDAAVFGLVGKVGIGGMDFSEDGNMLYLMNLYDRKIYSINFTNYWNTGTLPTAANVTSYAVPNPGCTGGDYRPFALKVYNNVLYAGLVCDGSTGTKSNMVAYVKGMDLTTNAWFDVFDFPLTYPKGYPDQADGSKVGWYKWSDVMSDVWSGSGAILHPVPILSDIEFDLDGTMVIALMDRTPQQMGNLNYDNPALNGGAFIAAGGDYLRAFYSNGAYVLENAAKAGPNVGFYPTNNQGPGFGEFYNDNIDGGVKYHTEMGTGGLVLVPGSGEVLAGMMDPNYFSNGPLYANGVRRLSNTTGNHTGGFSYVAGNSVDNFGKGIGIGDMEAATDNLTYLEVGNYVWRDTDADGIQDPAEIGIKDIILKLYKSSDGSLIGTATTDANGNYYFSTLNGLTILPNTDYCILAGVGQYVSGTITLAGVSYSLTAFNTGQGADPDLNDNDFSGTVLSTALGARPAGYPQFCVKTGEYGYINHTIDLGLIPCSISGTATAGSCNDNGTPYNTTDDYFQVSANATNGAAGPANQYEVVYNNVVIGTGTYGSSITVGTSTTPPFKPDGSSTYDLYIRDKDHKDCITGVLKVGPVVPCPKYYDYGDLPDTNSGLPNSYPTNNNNGGEGIGANHLIIEGLKIGATIDSESDGQPNAGATGDGNDEDGVVLPMFIAGQTATIPVTVMNMTGGTAKLTMFIDFNKNGNLDEVSEMTSANVSTGTNGVVNLTIAVPANAVANQNLGVRFRLSTDAVASMKATGQAPDGEVEDYITQVMAYDYGDLPDTDNGTGSYPTNVTSGGEGVGASHKIITGLKIGATIDAEGDGQPNITATGDDGDEDGVVLPMLIAGKTATVPVTVMNTTGSTAKLTMFVDFNYDHDFNDAGEMVSANVVTGTNGIVNLSLPVPADAVLNKEVGVRFRLSTNATQSMSPTGAAVDGEVEDYLVTVMGFDYGDLADTNNGGGSYPTNVTNGGEGVGPSHKIIEGLKIGNTIDAEGDGQPSTLADGDDNNGTSADDEDGVTLPAFNTGNTAIVPVKVMNMTGSTAKLTMFIDFNNNKSFADAGEMTSINVPAGTNSTLNLSIAVPVNAATNQNLGVRFRLSTDAAISMLPTGAAPDGEVEDYVTSITGSIITHNKSIKKVTNTGLNTYLVEYTINVINNGTGSGTYSLNDRTAFDDDIDISSANYTSNAPGNLGPVNLVGSGIWTLASNQVINANTTHTYTVGVNVKIDLLDGVKGDDKYFACGKAIANYPSSGEGLFNESRLDIYADGSIDEKDTACADLPFIIHDKTLTSVTPAGVNTYDVVYGIQVKNIGGASGQYDLQDEPRFDDDITQVSAKYLSSITGVTTTLGVPGPWLLANNQIIAAGATQNFTLTVRAKIDLEDGVVGDDKYTACGTATPGIPTQDEGLFNRSLLDVNDDGKYDYRDSVCADLPYIIHEKLIDNVVSTGINKYKITYKINVKNIGGAVGSYNLSDAPGFDDDITITASQYSTNAIGNAGNPGPVNLAGSGPWTLATNQNINPNVTQTYTIPVDVSVNLEAGSGGDNILKSCGQTVPGVPRVGEGLFNRSLLDLDKNGTPDKQDSVCYDIPYIIHDKEIVSVVPNGANQYTVNYKITVKNVGTVAGTYGLADAPKFDNDIDILSANYTSNAPGFGGPTNLAGAGPWTLSSNINLGAAGTHTYNLAVNVKIDLIDGVSGDDTYFKCNRSSTTNYTAGEGLFNESRLDLNNDGVADMRDTVCADLPFIIHDKTLTSVTPAGVNTYDVIYGIQVKNIGGAVGQYDLQDEPAFDDDITQVSAKYLSSITGVTTTLAIPGPWLLANNQTITAGATQNYTLTVRVKIDLEDGITGDDKYTACGTSTPGIPTQDEGLFNRSLLDVNHDGKYDYRDSVCADLPYIIHEKLVDNVVSTGINKYKITYKINVKNIGGAVGSYNLSDAPGFDDDIAITASQYSTTAIGNAGNPGPVNLAGSGPWTLATNQNINPNVTQTYTIPVDVSVNLEAGSGGDNILKSCGQTVPGVPRVGEGLFNRSLLDLDKNGTPDKQDSVCYDIPYIIHDKEIVSVVPNGANKYIVNYKITVKNVGTVAGTYGLADAPKFDDDIDILSATYTSNAPGFTGPTNLAGNGPWTLSTNESIGAGGTHTYNLAVNVKIDLLDGVSGDDKYFACNRSSTTNYTAGEGLFNESRLDLNNDGVADMRDTVCADLPFIIHDKTLTSVTPNAVNTYDVVYGIQVKNIGGAIGQYDLQDEPLFDDDISQVSAKYLSSVTGITTSLAVPGPWILANNQSIAAGATQNYTLTVKVKIDLEDGVTGDDKYTACGTSTPGIPTQDEGLFNRSLLDVNHDGKYDYRDSVCADLPYIIHEKLVDNVVPTGINKYKITYKIIVKNIGGAVGSYNLSDAPGFDDDIAITASQYSATAIGNAGNPGPVNLAGSGPWTLATNQSINAGVTQTYTIPVDVSVNLEAGSGGDNILKSCGQTVPGIPRVGEGLFNRSLLDLDKNGTPDKQDSVCYDLPYIIHDKELVSVVPNGANKYIVNYKITVKNIGTVAGNYGLADAPKFDDDIDIQSASYTSNAPGFTGPTNLVGNGPWTLSTNENIGAGGIHTYNLAVNVKIDLIDGVSGDDKYFACNRSSTTNYTAGEGLFNESRLDLNNDGVADMRDTVCADLPFIIHDKTITSITPVSINNYDVVYGIDVKNIGGAVGQYDLEDEPAFDDDITMISAKFLSSATGITSALVIPGPWKLANNQSIAAGITQKYTITVRVKIDLEDGVTGDDKYTACGTSTPGIPTQDEGLFNRSLLDVNHDGKYDYRDSVCADLPYIIHEKLVDNVVPTGINKYKITYKIIVKNIGGAVGSYNLSDAPGFDDDITITGAQYSTNASGNTGNPGPQVLGLVGPWTLATNQNINGFTTQTYTIPVDISVSLEAGSGGDNILRSCGQTVPGVPRVGEGLFNRSLLDLDKNGTPDRQDSVCYDLPYIIHDKEIVSVVPNGANQYTVNYKITVKNIGTVAGTYGLADAPKFDDDIDIQSASYTSNAPGFTGPTNLVGNGPWTLSTNENIGAGGIHTYNLAVNVKIDLIDGVSGDDKYFACNRSSTTNYTAGEGLFNESRLDLNNDGVADMRDTVCADLPFIIHDKTIIGVTPTGVNTYDIVYGIDVKNIGGATGQYDLRDEPKFDDDIAQTSAKYLSSVTGVTTNLPVPGPWMLATNQSIAAGATQKYTLTVSTKIDLEDGVSGDNRYSACESGTPGFPKENEGLFNRSLLDVNRDGKFDYRDSVCADIPYIIHEKLIDNVVSTGINKYKITYKINVKNIGGAVGSYNLSDAPGFDDDITITGSQFSSNAAGNAGNPGPVNLAGTGPWTLATNQSINAGTTQTYTLPVDVSISLEAGSGGDNILRACGQTVPGVPRVGEGLFNRSLLDLDKNGTPDRQDSVCYDLPYIVHDKIFVGTTQTGARTFKANYKIVVRNIGTAAGTYGLADAPNFDNDIDILSATYNSDAPGFTGPTNLIGTGPWTLSNNVNIAGGGVHTYNLFVDVRFDLSTSTGDKVYYQCGRSNPNSYTSGEGLFNESRLDLNNDGVADMRDTVCADLPYVEHEKFFTSVTKTGLGLYTVKYKVEVKNRGGAVGKYDLIDNPGLDDDFEILNAKLSSDASGNAATPGPIAIPNSGPWVFANDQNITPGVVQTYNLTLDVKIDLQTASSAGDEIYHYCGTIIPGIPSKGEGLFNESTLDVNNDGIPDQRDTVCQDVEIVDLALRKTVVTPAPYSYGQNINFKIEVINQGNVTMNQVEVADYLPKGYTLAAGNVGWSGVYPTYKKTIAGPLTPGSILTTNIILKLEQTSGGRMDWINYAEISKVVNSRNQDVTLDDEDSRPSSDGPAERAVKPGDPKDDDIFSRDKGGEEDDHDPAGIEVYDLALRKIYKGNYPIHYNDIVPFEITIFNQGNLTAKEIGVVDYVPEGYDWVVAQNGGWSFNSGTRMATQTYPGSIVPGDSAKLTVYLKVLVNYSGIQAWDNYSEIKSTKDTFGVVRLKDIDSYFDMTIDNDMGGVPNTKTDNFINDDGNDGDGDGIKDEDDHDPSRPEIVDLALRKWVLNKKAYYIPGEIVPYTLTVFNQGNVIMNSVTVNDYLYSGYGFEAGLNSGWTLVGNTLTKTQGGPLNPKDSMQFQLKLRVQVPVGASVESWWNYGEVRSMSDSNDKVRDNDDADSKPNSDTPYERSVKPGDPWDNVIDGQGLTENEDEDDHDPEKVIVTGYIGDYVWKDDNGNGIQDATEHGVKGVEVLLYDCKTNTIVKKDTTDVNGEYGFEFLLSGNYQLKFINPDTNTCIFTFKDKGANDRKDNDANQLGITDCIFLDWGKRDSTVDAGLILSASYGDFVWHDRNANGLQESGEEAIPNVEVSLYDGDTKLPVSKLFTDANGLYRFTKLLPGNYFAKYVADPMWNQSDPNTGNDLKDSDVDGSNGSKTNATTYLSVGEDDLSWDAGYWKCSMVSGRVFFDADMNGIFGLYDNGINGLEVYLVDANTGITIAKVLTRVNPSTPSDDGYYKFNCVKPGNYYLRFERPGSYAASEPYKGGNPDKDSDISHENGLNTTKTFKVLSDNMFLNIGAGFQTKATVGDYVWLDANFNGLQDSGEQPVEGVKVYAYKSNGTMVSQSVSQTDGHYTLDGIAQGDYFVKFVPPTNLFFTAAHTGNDDIDNDADGANGYGTTRTYRINSGDSRPTIDAGLVFQMLPLEWLSFEGRYNGSFTKLDWKTGIELNNDHFEVERRHESELAFTKISQVAASSNGQSKLHEYDYDDYDVTKSGVYYYRIKQVDKNGLNTYSRVISIKVDSKKDLSLSIYPNPTDEQLIVEMGLGEDSDLEVKVFDEAGKNVFTNPFGGFRKAGNYRDVIDTKILSVGHYNLQIKTTGGLINKRFTVMR